MKEKSNELIRAVLVVKGKEPEVITVENDIKHFENAIKQALTKEELELAPFGGVDLFGVGVPRVSGMVEEYSACHPYPRNRNWHGPALFTEYDLEGRTISMTDEAIEQLKNMFALSNIPKSSSTYINSFVEKYRPEPVVFNVEYKGSLGVLNTDDTIDFMLKEDREGEIKTIESMLKKIELDCNACGADIKETFKVFVKDLSRHLFEQTINNNEFPF